MVVGFWLVASASRYEPRATKSLFPTSSLPLLILNALLCQDSLFVGVLDLAHFGDSVGQLDNCRVGVPARQYNMHHLRLVLEAGGDSGGIEHAIADGIVDFVQNHEIPVAGLDGLFGLQPGF